ncbi:MAG: hypothetical protein J0L62_03000 [Bacteroidetes bacterium]|nr:hypothetical protein [Bacteroidota bacterium]
MKTKLISGINLLILLSFFLPWLTVSCENKTVTSLTGLDLVIGKVIESEGAFGQQDTHTIPFSPIAIAMAAAVFIGLILGVFTGKTVMLTTGFINFSAIILQWYLKYDIEQQIQAEGNGLFYVKTEFGFWLVFLFLILSLVWIGIIIVKKPKAEYQAQI